MTQYKITAPVADFRGEVAGVVFSQGQALLTVDDAGSPEGATSLPPARRALVYFERKGYTVEEVKKPEDAKLDTETANPGTPASTAVDPAGLAGTGVTAPAAPTPVSATELAAQAAAQNDGGDGDKPKPPAKSASKADFVEYATKHGGMTAKEADDMTRDQLAAKFHKEDAK
jgi:hypothetical protein